jgi:hypothetical protein
MAILALQNLIDAAEGAEATGGGRGAGGSR